MPDNGKSKSKTRPSIPDALKIKLLVLSGGRCQLEGCNEPVWYDGLTLAEGKFGDVAHIIGASKDGPRGQPNVSEELAKDYSNLMLLCKKHHRLVDHEKISDYPDDLLRKFKAEHEERIEFLTSLIPPKTHVIRLMGTIWGKRVSVSMKDAVDAIFPERYPATRIGTEIDLQNISEETDRYFELCANEIKRKIDRDLEGSRDARPIDHVSIFGIGRIPVLFNLGLALSDKIPGNVFQLHRESGTWRWNELPDLNKSSFESSEPANLPNSKVKDIVLQLSISGTIHDSEVPSGLCGAPSYEIAAKEPSVYFMRSHSQLHEFKTLYRETLTRVRKQFGENVEVHILPAIPVSVAIECGRVILPAVDPKIHLYDKINGSFSICTTVN